MMTTTNTALETATKIDAAEKALDKVTDRKLRVQLRAKLAEIFGILSFDEDRAAWRLAKLAKKVASMVESHEGWGNDREVDELAPVRDALGAVA